MSEHEVEVFVQALRVAVEVEAKYSDAISVHDFIFNCDVKKFVNSLAQAGYRVADSNGQAFDADTLRRNVEKLSAIEFDRPRSGLHSFHAQGYVLEPIPGVLDRKLMVDYLSERLRTALPDAPPSRLRATGHRLTSVDLYICVEKGRVYWLRGDDLYSTLIQISTPDTKVTGTLEAIGYDEALLFAGHINTANACRVEEKDTLTLAIHKLLLGNKMTGRETGLVNKENRKRFEGYNLGEGCVFGIRNGTPRPYRPQPTGYGAY